MPLVFQPPFITMLMVVTVWLMHAFLGPWDTVLRMPRIGTLILLPLKLRPPLRQGPNMDRGGGDGIRSSRLN